MSAGGGHFERSPPDRLSPDVGQIGKGRAFPSSGRWRRRRWPLQLAPQGAHQLSQVGHPPDVMTADQSGVGHLPRDLGGWVPLANLVLHVAGALKHQFISNDDVVARMIPFLRRHEEVA